MKLCKRIHFLNEPFLLFIVLSIFLAYLYPEIGSRGGLLKPEITVKYGAVIIIFLISGVSLDSKELVASVYQYHIHLFIQCFSFICIPILVQVFVQLFSQLYPNSDLMVGFVAVSCMPPPVSSAVLLTKTVGGNEAAAVFNSALGSFLGIVFTPALLYLFFTSSSEVPLWSAIVQLSGTLIFPVFIGQWLRNLLGREIVLYKKKLSMIGSSMLLLIIYSTFCETFSKQNEIFTFSTVIITSIAVLLLQLILLALVFYSTKNLFQVYTAKDCIAILYCSTHKSLTLGFPMLKVLYGNEAHFFLISFPLLIYHPMQILVGSILVPVLQNYLLSKSSYLSKLLPV